VTNLPLLRGIARHPEFAAAKFDTGFIERELSKLLARPALTPAALAAAVADEMGSAGGSGTPWQADGWRLGGDGGLRLIAREQDGKEHAVQASGKLAALNLTVDGKPHAVQALHMSEVWILNLDDVEHCAQVYRHGDERQVISGAEAWNFLLASPYAPKTARVADEAAHPLSPMPGRVVAVHVKAGDKVVPGQALMVLEGMKMEYTVKAVVAGSIEKVLHKPGDMVEAETPLVDIKAGDE
jgi:3-methylcrotonyl-CoA carboxylase alpha subunit